MSSPAPFGNLKGEIKELCDGLEPTVVAVTLTSNERTTSFTLAEQSKATASTSIPRSSMDKISYKLLSNRRRLVNTIKHLRDDLSGVSSLVSFKKIAPEFHNFVKSYWEFRSEVDEVIDLAHVGELICDLAADYENLCSSFKDLESRFVGSSARDEDDVAVKASDSVSQASLGRTSSSSKSSAARRMELECKRASLLAICDLEKSKAKAKAVLVEAKVKEADVEAEAEAKFRIEEAKLAAEERFIALSEPGLSEAGSRRSASKVVEREKISVVMSSEKHSYCASCAQERNFEQYIQFDKETVRERPEASISKPLYNQSGPVETKPFVNNPDHSIFNEWREPRGRHINDVDATSRFAHFRPEHTNSKYVAGDSRVLNDHVFQTYLDRQNRKEYIYHLKHATVLHDLYVRSSSVDFKATNTKESVNVCDSPSISEENKHVVARKICPSNKIVLLRTCAVKVINPRTGRFTLAYAQHDTASQGTIVSKTLMDKLGLVASKRSEIHIRTLANEFTPCRGVVNFELESLTTGERFDVENALVVPELVKDECVFPHSVDTSGLQHFDGVNIPILPYKRCIDILIGQTDKFLFTVLEERKKIRPEDPNYVLTRLCPIATGGCVDGRNCSERKLHTLKVNLECCNKNDCVKLKQEVLALREQLRRYILEDEEIQVSTSDEITRELVEPNVNVVNNRYEIPVPLKVDVVEAFPNNYANALNRNFLLRKRVLKITLSKRR